MFQRWLGVWMFQRWIRVVDVPALVGRVDVPALAVAVDVPALAKGCGCSSVVFVDVPERLGHRCSSVGNCACSSA